MFSTVMISSLFRMTIPLFKTSPKGPATAFYVSSYRLYYGMYKNTIINSLGIDRNIATNITTLMAGAIIIQ